MSEIRTITAADETEAAIWAEGTSYTKHDILRAYRSHLSESAEPMDIQRFCTDVLKIDTRGDGCEYSIAFVLEGTGGFEIVERFRAGDDAAANDYAERAYADRDWYVLDVNGNNING